MVTRNGRKFTVRYDEEMGMDNGEKERQMEEVEDRRGERDRGHDAVRRHTE